MTVGLLRRSISRGSINRRGQARALRARVSEFNPMPSRIIEESHRPRVSDRTMHCHSSSGQSSGLLFQKTTGAVTTAKWNHRKKLFLRTSGDEPRPQGYFQGCSNDSEQQSWTITRFLRKFARQGKEAHDGTPDSGEEDCRDHVDRLEKGGTFRRQTFETTSSLSASG